jgi:hypothetical protein
VPLVNIHPSPLEFYCVTRVIERPLLKMLVFSILLLGFLIHVFTMLAFSILLALPGCPPLLSCKWWYFQYFCLLFYIFITFTCISAFFSLLADALLSSDPSPWPHGRKSSCMILSFLVFCMHFYMFFVAFIQPGQIEPLFPKLSIHFLNFLFLFLIYQTLFSILFIFYSLCFHFGNIAYVEGGRVGINATP